MFVMLIFYVLLTPYLGLVFRTTVAESVGRISIPVSVDVRTVALCIREMIDPTCFAKM